MNDLTQQEQVVKKYYKLLVLQADKEKEEYRKRMEVAIKNLKNKSDE